ncbi:MAG: DHH family phosphoesterase [Limosilactobacillus gorillae]|jgi:cyclic-di-AMP phosphodiesterase|uniref:DHH family phosphoesterase n=1 Tax=Limosilactobacillus gorillae TaxID=1450649 RepID=UPI000AA6868A|nr:DHH family phosphoesterase [Limosilactobacillus gorillae]MDO4855599.1 DHH family phosphoesterase [Limosilactobacillus gorillae]
MLKRWFGRESVRRLLHSHVVQLNSAYVMFMSLVTVIVGFSFNWRVGLALLAFVILCLVVAVAFLQRLASSTEAYVNDLAYQVQQGQEEALYKMPIGMILLNDHDVVRWINPYMARYFDQDLVVGQALNEVDERLADLVNNHRRDEHSVIVTWQKRQFEFLVQERTHTVYLMDVTEYEQINNRYKEERLFMGTVYLDNYVELVQGMSDSEVSNLRNYVTSELTKWAEEYHLLVKVIDDDNYLLIGHEGDLTQLEEDKFKILDKIRQNTTRQNSPVTLSIGIAYGQSDLIKLADNAQKNLDLALGRGGDQVVVRAESGQARFYGGKTNPMEKRTRVRARMIAQALRELMNQADQIFVVGHAKPDMDSLGACLGIRRIAEMNDHQCWVVFDNQHVHSDITRLMGEINDYQSIKDHLISPEQALEMVTTKSLLVMVDHSKVSISMAPELCAKLSNRMVIIDHHRRGEEFPENPLLVYNEPYASSTCELITEMFEYQPRKSQGLNRLEATAMLTGIRVDTKSFSQNAGTRTYDAASYLRSAGADGMLIQRLMKENPSSFLARNHLIAAVTFIDGKMALCVGENDRVYDPVTAAQAADMLLQMDGIDASFVISRRSSTMVGVSARSLGDFNVQVIMEQMGGGGHLANAATQVAGKSVEEVKDQLVQIINGEKDPTSTEDEEEDE